MSLEMIITELKQGEVDPRFDCLDSVEKNRNKILKPKGIKDNFVRMNPKQDTGILFIDDVNKDRWLGQINDRRPEVDALVTNLHNIGLECDPGDCPVYVLHNPQYNFLSLVHSGRNGSVKGILEKTIRNSAKYLNTKLRNYTFGLKVFMAPAICGEHYRLNHLTLSFKECAYIKDFLIGSYDIESTDNNNIKLTSKQGFGFDMVNLNFNRLLELGIREENMEISNICTYESPHYPSYRQHIEKGTKNGRFMVMAFMR